MRRIDWKSVCSSCENNLSIDFETCPFVSIFQISQTKHHILRYFGKGINLALIVRTKISNLSWIQDRKTIVLNFKFKFIKKLKFAFATFGSRSNIPSPKFTQKSISWFALSLFLSQSPSKNRPKGWLIKIRFSDVGEPEFLLNCFKRTRDNFFNDTTPSYCWNALRALSKLKKPESFFK